MGNEHSNELLDVRIRAGRAGEGKLLREIAIAAKSYWGYDSTWVREWAEGGDFSAEALAQRDVFVADVGSAPVGWEATIPKGEVCWLEDLWVAPAWIGKGIGTRLWRYAAEHAQRVGARRLEWEAEPNAVGFYERMGGRYLRDSEASEWGRALPVMGVALNDNSAG
ncbi:MAG: GNAT family N-acetyltransferase [Actinomycetota bacterium]|nr:GNAT family N-acetyltransferase [Actinomycetota bacterium]